MLQNGWQIIQTAYERYAATGVVQLLLICALLIILIKEKNKENLHLAYYVILLMVFIFLPPIAFIFGKYFIGEDVYWRTFWLIPSVVVVAYVATGLVEQQGRKFKRNGILIALTLLIIVGGKLTYNNDNFNKSTNAYKIPQEAIEVCDIIAKEGKARAIFPETIVSYIRQYDPQIEMLYGRNLGKDIKKGKTYDLLLQLNSQEPDIAYIAESAKERECKYVVFENFSLGIEEMTAYGFENCGSTKNYTVFKQVD
jgi:hypothetical protein